MRYARQLLIPQIGRGGQEKLKKSRVTVIGCGGLGSPVLTYLACAGVGTIVLVDHDVVSETDLNRQFLYQNEDFGKSKVASAWEKLTRLNPEINIIMQSVKIDTTNAEKIIAGSDVVVDCVDGIDARITVAKACLRLDIPLVEGGIHGYYGYVLDIGRAYPCLSCIGYDKSGPKTPIPVLGATAGVIGSLQANECIKLLLGIGEPLFGRMLHYDGLSCSWDEVRIEKSNFCPVHGKISSES